MPIGIKGFLPGNVWRFQPNNRFGKGGVRVGAGRPRDFSPEEEEILKRTPKSFKQRAFWYIRVWLSRPEIFKEMNHEELRSHKFILRIFRRSYGGAHLARVKRFYANVQKRRLER